MSHVFEIDPGRPQPNVGVAGLAADLSEAVQMCFPMDTVDARLQWGGVSIPLSYKYDLSVIVEDVVELLEHCFQGCPVDIRFGSDTFNASWSIRPQGEVVGITAEWESVVGDTEDELNRMPTQIVPKQHFLEQWSHLLGVMLAGLERTDVAIEDEQLLEAVKTLVQRIGPGEATSP